METNRRQENRPIVSEIDDEGHIFEYVGLYFNIAIKKENAEIVKMWLE